MSWKRLLSLSLALLLLPTSARAEETVTYYHNDGLGSPVASSNAAGEVIWREQYRPYGARIIKDAASIDTSLWFTGHREDSESSLTYMGARYYDPVAGRFMGMDPAAVNENDPRTFNRYAYAFNNPYGYIDPDGAVNVRANRWGGGLGGGGPIHQFGPIGGYSSYRGSVGGSRNAGPSSIVVKTQNRELQKFHDKTNHGEAWGLKGEYSPKRAGEVSGVIHKHINSPNVKVIKGKYQDEPATHYFDPKTKNNIVVSPKGEFITGYRLQPHQAERLLRDGTLGRFKRKKKGD